MLSPEFILELTYWTPLIALLLSSLGLIALKRISGLPPWAQRLATPPFYFVSLPIATLIVGTEMLAWYALYSYALHSWLVGFIIWYPAWFSYLINSDVLLMSRVFSVVFWAALFVSGRLMWRSVSGDDGREYPSNKAVQHLRGFLLLFVFAWTFLSLRTFILFLAEGWLVNLTISCATSRDASIYVYCC
jgi:hypothetical protein